MKLIITYIEEKNQRICCLRAGGGRDISGGFGLEKYDGKFDYFIDNVNIECLIPHVHQISKVTPKNYF